MWLTEEEPSMKVIYDALRRLGITANYKGFYYAAYAVLLCARRPEVLLLATKWLYPEVAARYQTTWKAVERNIRTVVAVAWKQNPELLFQLAGHSLTEKPQPGQFLSILASGLFAECGQAEEFRVEK